MERWEAVDELVQDYTDSPLYETWSAFRVIANNARDMLTQSTVGASEPIPKTVRIVVSIVDDRNESDILLTAFWAQVIRGTDELWHVTWLVRPAVSGGCRSPLISASRIGTRQTFRTTRLVCGAAVR
jgi:hypothetical protein